MPEQDLTQIIILGASGDLTARKLVPAVAAAHAQRLFPGPMQMIGVARRPWDDQSFRKQLDTAAPRPAGCDDRAWREVMALTSYIQTHLDTAEDYAELGRRLVAIAGSPCHRVFYLAVKPELFLPAVTNLHRVGLLEQSGGRHCRVVVEKPFGTDLATAKSLNSTLLGMIGEDQLYRIDHYLGKETVQNLLVMRLRNAFFEPLWNQKYIELVQITVAENLGMEGGRGGYYDTAGAVRDILQNHCLQLLALVAMEPPGRLDPKAIHDEKVKVLQGLRLPTDEPEPGIVRGQYQGYRGETGVAKDSPTETYIATRTYIDNWRWGSVPFLLRTGKHMKSRFTSIAVQFRMPPHTLFGSYTDCHLRPNTLTVRIQPNEGIDLAFDVKEPGAGLNVAPAKLAFDYQDYFHKPSPEAYQRLLLDVVLGDQSLFLRSDEVEESWRWADSLRLAMLKTPLHGYERESWGPDAANGLFKECEGRWVQG